MKSSMILAELLPNTLALNIPHLAERQTWLIEEALRIDEAIKSMDKQIAFLLYGDKEKGYQPHPYTKILMSFPIMSESMACTFIGAIGDIERFSTYLKLKKYLGEPRRIKSLEHPFLRAGRHTKVLEILAEFYS